MVGTSDWRVGAGRGAGDPVWVHVGAAPPATASGRVLLTRSLLSPVSDYVIDDKVAVLQKRDHEGFGFVLRGAKGEEGRGGWGVRLAGAAGCRRPSSGLSHYPARPPRAGPPCPSATTVVLVRSAGTRGGDPSSAVPRSSAVVSLTRAGVFQAGRVGSFSGGPGRLLVPRAAPLPPPGSRAPLSSAPAAACPGVLAKCPLLARSRDPHRGVHAHAGLPGAAVPGVGGRGGRGLEGRAAHRGLPHRGEAVLLAGAVRPLGPRRTRLDRPRPPACLSQVNGVNVVKVGHKQVVALIRQGGNRLVMKVVSVTRKPEEDGARRRGEGSGC